MATSTITSVIINNSVQATPSHSFVSTLIAVARGMKKDGFTDVEIAKETNLSLSLITKLKRKRQRG